MKCLAVILAVLGATAFDARPAFAQAGGPTVGRNEAATRPAIADGDDAATALLKGLDAKGLAAGNVGDHYQNSDGWHADNLDKPRLKPARNVHPQVTRNETIRYTAETVTRDYPPKVPDFGPPTLWNSSQFAGKGMSFPNWCVSEQDVAERCYRAYVNNVHFVNPALWDYAWRSSYKGGKPAEGNLPCGFQTMSPYMTASRGHSHSEGGLQRDMWYGLAGFRPEVKKRLIETGLLMPTLNMAFRRGRVDTDAQYLSAEGNPFAFVGDEQYFGPGEKVPKRSVHRGAEIVQITNAITLKDIPPLIQLRVLQDAFPAAAVMSTTPCAIARRMPEGQTDALSLTVSAKDSRDLNGRPLKYTWVVLYGPADAATLTAQGDGGEGAKITFKSCKPFTVKDGDLSLDCRTLVVACFANNGVWYSAPGFVTCTMLTPRTRLGPGTQPR